MLKNYQSHQKYSGYVNYQTLYKNSMKLYNLYKKYKKSLNNILKERDKSFQDFISFLMMNCYKFFQKQVIYRWLNNILVSVLKLQLNYTWQMEKVLNNLTSFVVCYLHKNKESCSKQVLQLKMLSNNGLAYYKKKWKLQSKRSFVLVIINISKENIKRKQIGSLLNPVRSSLQPHKLSGL